MQFRIPTSRHLSALALAVALPTLCAMTQTGASAAISAPSTVIALTAKAGKQTGKQTRLRVTAAAYPAASCRPTDATTSLKGRPLQAKVKGLVASNTQLQQVKLAYDKLRSTAKRVVRLGTSSPLLAKPSLRSSVVRAAVGPEEPMMVISVAAYAEAFAGAEAAGYAAGFASGALAGAGVVIVGGLIVYGAYWCYENYGGDDEAGATEPGAGTDTPPATPGGTPTPTATETPTNPTDASVPGSAAFGH